MTTEELTTEQLNALRYPIGEYSPQANISNEDIRNFISIIEAFPQKLKREVTDLTDEQLDTPYREGGWRVIDVVHHVCESHMNSFMRFKLALTEDTPTIKTYYEDRWAKLGDYKYTPLEVSLNLLESLHIRWVILLKSLTTEQLKRRFIHPEHKGEMTLDELMHLYAWHSEHHLAHIVNLKKRMGW